MSKTTTPTPSRDELLQRVKSHLERFVAFSNENHSLVLSLWILHTHAFDTFDTTPYVYISSVDPGAGKSTLMESVADLSRNPSKTDVVTSSYLFRNIEANRPTLIIDEVDTIYAQGGAATQELRGVLNGGYEYSGKIGKTIDGEPTEFSTFCPKMLGGLDNGLVPPTVLDRAIRIRLHKLSGDKLAELNIERRNIRRLRRDETLDILRHDLSKWGNVKTIDALGDIMDKLNPIPGLSARQWDIVEPLMAVATLMGVKDAARAALTAIFMGEKIETEEMKVLSAARELFDGTETDRITNTMLSSMTGITPDRLGRLMSKLGAKPRPIKIAGKVARGWYRTDLEAAWEKFL